MRAHGVDLSGHQLRFNADIPGWKFDFVYNKYSEGQLDYIHDYPDSARRENQDQMLEESLKIKVRGGYHFLRSDYPWKKQADTYLECVEKLRDDGYKTHFHVLDGGESANNEWNKEFANFHYEWWRYVDSQSKEVVMNYHNLNTAHELFNKYGHKWHNRVPMITAQYWYDLNARRKPEWNPLALELRYNGMDPRLWDGRKTWQMWQVTGLFPGRTEGVTGSMSMDYNIWNGDKYHLWRYFKIRYIIRKAFFIPRRMFGSLRTNRIFMR